MNNGLVAAFLSAVVPGLGHGYLGRWKRAIVFFVPILIGVVAALFFLDLSTIDLIGYAVRPTVLKSILLINLGIVAWRVLAITDAYVAARESMRWWKVIVVAIMCLGVALPHIVITQYTLDAAYALDEVFVSADDTAPKPFVFADDPFADDEVLPTVADPKVTVSTYDVRDYRSRIFQEGLGDPDAIAMASWYGSTQGTTAVDRFGEDAEGVDRITILLAGGDGGPGRSGSRTDSINVVTFDTKTGKAAVFGIPRNMTHVPLPDEWSTAFTDLEKQLTPYAERKKWTDENGDGEPDQFVPCHCFPDQINAIYPFTRTWTETYPDEREPGLAALRDVLELMLGLDIDYYAFVNMGGFVDVVNALGGVNVYVTRPVSIEMSPAKEGEEWYTVSIGAGWRKLSGLDALGYVRERHSSNDYVRMARQRCLLKAVAAKATPATILRRFSALSKAMANSVKTDIDIDYLPTLLEFTGSLDFDDIATVGFVPPFYTPVLDFRGKPTPDLLRIQAMVQFALNADADTAFDTGANSECRV